MKKIYALLKRFFIVSTLFFTALLQAQTQKGADINGEAAGDQSGWSVSMPDANTVAVGAFQNDGNGANSGQVRIFTFNGTTWVQKGADIDGEAAGDQSGFSVSMPDTNTVAVGAIQNDGNGLDSGQVRIFIWNGTTWVQKGLDIDGEAAVDQFGNSVSMPDPDTVAVGANLSDGNGFASGQVRIFTWDGTDWVQKGIDINGEASVDQFGVSVSMPDPDTVAVGATQNDGNGVDSGQARIFIWNGTTWVQKGTDIDGEAAGDLFGNSVSMPDANTVAVGAVQNDGNGADSGHVRIFTWDGTAWAQNGVDIDGEAADDYSGWVSMPDANTVAIGALFNDGNGNNSGHVRVYDLPTLSLSDFETDKAVILFPNPAQKTLRFNLSNALLLEGYEIYNLNGQRLAKGGSLPQGGIEVSGLSKGLYLLKLQTNKGVRTLKFIKQ